MKLQRMKKMKRLFVLLMLVLLCVGCAHAEDVGEIVPKYEVMYIPVGKEMYASFTTTSEKLKKSAYAYEISDESVISVNYKGAVKGLEVGESVLTIISKKYPEVFVHLPVEVVDPVKKVIATVPSTTMNVGETLQIEATCQPETATIREVNYFTSNEKVAVVDENGVITAVGRGGANITVQSEDRNAKTIIELSVRQLPEEIRFKQDSYVLAVGKKTKFGVSVHPSNANDRAIVWSSSDETVAPITKDGSLTAKSAGTAIITASSKADPNVKTSVTVRCVVPIQTITLDKAQADLRIGETVQLNPAYTPENATIDVVYTTSNPQVCSVDKNGLITALDGGESIVRVLSSENQNRKAEMKVYVHVPVEGITVDQKGLRLAVGDHAFGTVKIRPGSATNKEMTWVSSDESIATVTNTSNRPRIVGHKWGSCTLTGTTASGGFTAQIQVYVGELWDALHATQAIKASGEARVTLENRSDMHITGVTLGMKDAQGQLVETVLAVDLAPFSTSEPLAVALLGEGKEVTVVAWETDTGYHTNAGVLKNSYRLSGGMMEWIKVK